MLKKHTTCRSCGNQNLIDVFNLGVVPLANSFKLEGEEQDGYAPLTVAFCDQCSLAQLRDTVSPEILYKRNYPYITSNSETMRDHFEAFWKEAMNLASIRIVIEIGSNNGDFLEFAKSKGAVEVLGIDAADNLVEIANAKGIHTVGGGFDEYTAEYAHTKLPLVDLIVARHVFAHIDDWKSFVVNLDKIASADTIIAIEFPWAKETLERCEWDQVYHEHLSYITIRSIEALLKDTAFQIQKVTHFPVHGGSAVIYLNRRGSCFPHSSVDKFLSEENITQISWLEFALKARMEIHALFNKINKLKLEGKKICGFGASAKSTVWINACGFTKRHIDFIVDNTPQKQGRFSPGSDIEIRPESYLTNDNADVAICFAWNFWDTIIAKNQKWIDGGGIFINPHGH